MRKNILGRPTGEIEPGAVGQKAETGRRQIGAILTRKHDVELFLQGMQMQDVGCGIGHLRITKFFGAPVGELLLLWTNRLRGLRVPGP